MLPSTKEQQITKEEQELATKLTKVATQSVNAILANRGAKIKAASYGALTLGVCQAIDKRDLILGKKSSQIHHHLHTLQNENGETLTRQQLRNKSKKAAKNAVGSKRINASAYDDMNNRGKYSSNMEKPPPLEVEGTVIE